MELTRDDVEAGFHELGEILHRERKVAEIAVDGGVAVMLQLDAAFRTRDVDAVVETGDHGAFEAAVAEVARRRGWLRSWVSEAVSVYLGARPDLTLYGTYPSEERAGTRDEEDARRLADATGIRSFEAMLDLLRRHFPGEEPDARSAALVRVFAKRFRDPAAS